MKVDDKRSLAGAREPNVDDLVRRPGAWLSMRRDTGIAISSRVRLARNVRDVAFPGWAGEEECVRLCATLRDALGRLPALRGAAFFDMASLRAVDREVLKERHLISRELAGKGRGSGVVVVRGEGTSIMINEEDHLRLQAISPGLNLRHVLKRVDAVDSALESHVDYAFGPRLGYLTACPSNVGTGLRASVMLHLPGLKLLNELEPVVKGLERMRVAVRGLLGEGTDAYGCMFQLSNQTTLGESEEEILAGLTAVVKEVVEHEGNARLRLMETRRIHVLDHVARAFGILMNARVLSSQETLDLLSAIRLGVEIGLVANLTVPALNEIMLLTQPGHVQKMAARVIDPEQRDLARAVFVRERLADVAVGDTAELGIHGEGESIRGK